MLVLRLEVGFQDYISDNRNGLLSLNFDLIQVTLDFIEQHLYVRLQMREEQIADFLRYLLRLRRRTAVFLFLFFRGSEAVDRLLLHLYCR